MINLYSNVMKKIVLFISLLFCLSSPDVWSQTQVRGIESRRVIYAGPEYHNGQDYSYDYYGWEFYNANSIPVSVDIELWSQAAYAGDDNQIVKTQSIILKPGEKYIFKREEHISTRAVYKWSGLNRYPISNYYVTYKAYKLE